MLRIRGPSLICRQYSSGVFKAANIRKIFLEYFMNTHGHKFVRSSPVVPFCDPSVAFVNAGMNQFKSVFLGKTTASHPRVVNSQKCVRVGGKHNDLSMVGRDGYHHTFFEMLGNWSFGDYYKKEACEMVLALLEGPFKIDRSRLYVTYFGGDEKLQLPADMECFEIWRNLGFSAERIIPFGTSENFWEMGSTGPCGPCTEIHIDHFPNSKPSERVRYVNAGRSDLTELWNIVFIEYNRNPDNSISLLPQKHVDTGMGFERLAAVIQNKSSNYDTDLFTPIFEIIRKTCKTTQYNGTFLSSKEKVDLDTAYRIIADHGRMITACLSDGMLPDQNQKLRRVLRTALLLSENVFKKEQLLDEIVPTVVEILGPTYPEMGLKLKDTLEIVHHEHEIFKLLREKSEKNFLDILAINPELQYIDLVESSGFVPAFKELQGLKHSFTNATIPGEFLFKLRDTYGLNSESIENIAKIENLKLDEDGLNWILDSRKQKYRLLLSNLQTDVSNALLGATIKVDDTDDRYKYDYEFQSEVNRYNIHPLQTTVIAIFQNGTEKLEAKPNKKDQFQLICAKSNFYCESGGQQSDTGYIRINRDGEEVVFQVTNVTHINGCVVHSGKFINYGQHGNLKIGDKVVLTVDSTPRTLCTIHHTATHLLNAAVRRIVQKVTYQVSSAVTYENLKLELGIIGRQLNKTDITEIEDLIRKVINNGLDVKTTVTIASDIFNDPNIITVPGEIYPETNVRLLCIEDKTINFLSKELCCGTHVSNTSEIRNFCITNFKQLSRSRYAFTAVAGELAQSALERANNLNSLIDLLEKELQADNAYDSVETELLKVKKQIQNSYTLLPYVFRMNSLERVNALLKVILENSRTILKNLVEIEMKNLLQEKSSNEHPFIIHFLKASAFVKSLPLQRATRLCLNRPIIVISCTEGILKARCCVPFDKISDTFTAEQWLREFASVFKGEVSPPRGQNPKEVCNMKAKKIVRSIFDDQLEVAIKKANKFAMDYL